MAQAHWIARAGPSKVAKKPSPAVSISRPRNARELRAHEAVVALDEIVPLAVAELDRLLRRADDVGEEHRREHAVDLRLLPSSLGPDAVQELRDRFDDLVGVDPGRVVDPGQLDQLRAGNALSEVATVARWDPLVDAVNEPRGHANRRQHVADVDLHVHASELTYRRGARALPLEARPPVDELLVACGLGASHETARSASARVPNAASRSRNASQPLLARRRVRIVRRPRRPRRCDDPYSTAAVVRSGYVAANRRVMAPLRRRRSAPPARSRLRP